MKQEEHYIETAPSIQNAVDIFKGAWLSILPIENVNSGGYVPLFTDPKVKKWDALHPVAGKKILELGPLEGGHTYCLEKLGASSVTSIESNNISFMKCLIVKDIFKLNANLLYGDFREYLKNCNDRYDIVIASGVLYHMLDPVQLIKDISRVTDVVFIWSHYYSKERQDLSYRYEHAPTLLQSKYKVYKHFYLDSLNSQLFCGGSRPYSYWFGKEDLINAFRDHGFSDIELLDDIPDHPNGSCYTLLAKRM